MRLVIYFQNGNILEVIKNFGRKFLELYFGGHIGFWDELRLTRFEVYLPFKMMKHLQINFDGLLKYSRTVWQQSKLLKFNFSY